MMLLFKNIGNAIIEARRVLRHAGCTDMSGTLMFERKVFDDAIARGAPPGLLTGHGTILHLYGFKILRDNSEANLDRFLDQEIGL
jgi:hypothetical protein